jgi:hypothetical protein
MICTGEDIGFQFGAIICGPCRRGQERIGMPCLFLVRTVLRHEFMAKQLPPNSLTLRIFNVEGFHIWGERSTPNIGRPLIKVNFQMDAGRLPVLAFPTLRGS